MQVILIRPYAYLSEITFVCLSLVFNQDIVFKTLKSTDVMHPSLRNANDWYRLGITDH